MNWKEKLEKLISEPLFGGQKELLVEIKNEVLAEAANWERREDYKAICRCGEYQTCEVCLNGEREIFRPIKPRKPAFAAALSKAYNGIQNTPEEQSAMAEMAHISMDVSRALDKLVQGRRESLSNEEGEHIRNMIVQYGGKP